MSLAELIGEGPAMACMVGFIAGTGCYLYRLNNGRWPWGRK